MLTHPPPLASLLALYVDAEEEPPLVYRANVTSTEPESEAARVLRYLRGLGFAIATTKDVVHAIDALDDEEELSAHPVAEGVAVTHASDGWWLLFTEN